MSVSSPFIRRSVTTTLLNLSIVLAGAVAFTRLPVSPLPQVDFPAIMVTASLPGASPETMASSVATPLERALGTIAGVNEITSMELPGLDANQPPVRSRQGHQCGCARGAGRHQCLTVAAAERDARHAELPEDEPVAGADHDPGADLEDEDPERDLRSRLDRPRAEGRAGHRRRRRDRRRRVAAGGARRARAERAHPVRDLARRRAPGHHRRQPAAAQGRRRGRAAVLAGPGERSARQGRRLPAADHPLP